VINEPPAGDLYRKPWIMVPWPNPTNGDATNLQPLYDRVNAAVRSVDDDVLLFVPGVTWGDLGAGFTAAPGGAAYANRTVISYHYYQPPQVGRAQMQVETHAYTARRLGTGAMMTETEALWAASYKDNDIADACDASLQGWADWAWKSFVRPHPNGEANSTSQYYLFGAPKTGHGEDWGPTPDSPPAYYTTDLARTYAPRVAGAHQRMSFDKNTSSFTLLYEVGAAALAAHVPTEIFLWPGRYPTGAEVSASVSAGMGAVSVEYDGGATTRWVRVLPGDGLKVGAQVTVRIAAKPSAKRQSR